MVPPIDRPMPVPSPTTSFEPPRRRRTAVAQNVAVQARIDASQRTMRTPPGPAPWRRRPPTPALRAGAPAQGYGSLNHPLVYAALIALGLSTVLVGTGVRWAWRTGWRTLQEIGPQRAGALVGVGFVLGRIWEAGERHLRASQPGASPSSAQEALPQRAAPERSGEPASAHAQQRPSALR